MNTLREAEKQEYVEHVTNLDVIIKGVKDILEARRKRKAPKEIYDTDGKDRLLEDEMI